MSKPIIVAEGIFSTLTISLNDGIRDKLATIQTEENPLASVKDKLEIILMEFEAAYFEKVRDHQPEREKP